MIVPVVILTWLYTLLSLSGDIFTHIQGPSSIHIFSADSSYGSVYNLSNFLCSPNYFSLMHYKIQSLLPKLDLLATELRSFILTFSETWLADIVLDKQILILDFLDQSVETVEEIRMVELPFISKRVLFLKEEMIWSCVNLSVSGLKLGSA